MRTILAVALFISIVIATMETRRATREGYDQGWHDGVKATLAELEKQAAELNK